MNIVNLFSVYIESKYYKSIISNEFSTIITTESNDLPEKIRFIVVDKIQLSDQIKINNQFLFKSDVLSCVDNNEKVVKIEVKSDKYVISVENGIDNGYLLLILNSIIKILVVNYGGLAVHSSMVGNNDFGVLLTGWGGVGKTSFILNACKGNKVSVGDEWNLISDSKIYPMRNYILLMYYDVLNNTHLVRLIDKARMLLFDYLSVRYIERIFERMRITLRCKKIVVKKICKSKNNTIPLGESVHHFKDKGSVNNIIKISGNKYSQIITSNFIHESSHLIEMLNYLNLTNNEKEDLVILFLKKYKDNANKIFKNVDCSLSCGGEFNSDLYVDKVVNNGN